MSEELAAQRKAFEERSLRENTPEGRQIIELLWNPKEPDGARGPKPKISLDQVVTSGIEIVDSEGLEPLSMRKVAKSLGVGAMSLYTYVPGKSELVELMVDRVFGETRRPDSQLDWRAQTEFLARESWELFHRHHWLLDYNQARLPLGPNVMDSSEALFAAIGRSGLGAPDIIRIVNLITWQVYGMARSVIFDAEEERASGVSADSFWIERGSFWFTYYDPHRFPVTSQLYESGAFDDGSLYSFESTLSRLMDAIELYVSQNAADHPLLENSSLEGED